MIARWSLRAAIAGLICLWTAAAIQAGRPDAKPNAPVSQTESAKPAPSVAATGAPDASWKLVWQDEFNGEALDPARWNIEETTPTNPGMGLDVFSPANVRVHDGLLEIKAHPQGDGKYQTALIETRRKGFWKHGRFEVRMKTPRGPGTNSAFWMMPNVKEFEPWPKSGEIDIAEKLGREPTQSHGTIHYPGERLQRDHGVYNRDETLTEDLGDDFHVYAVEWRKGSFEWFLDGKSFHRTAQPDMANFPFNRQFFLILVLSMGGKWTGDPAPNTAWPMTLQVDWVRVYQSDEDAAATEKAANSGKQGT